MPAMAAGEPRWGAELDGSSKTATIGCTLPHCEGTRRFGRSVAGAVTCFAVCCIGRLHSACGSEGLTEIVFCSAFGLVEVWLSVYNVNRWQELP